MGRLGLWALALALVAGSTGMAQAAAKADYPADAILSTSGNAAFLGQTRQKTLKVLEALVNKEGGIDGHKLVLTFHDDQTNPQVAVQVTSAILAKHPAVLFGATLTSTCGAEQPLLQRAGPVAYCFSPGIHPKHGGYMFSASVSTRDLITAVFRYFNSHGLTRVASISSTDATGQEMENNIDVALKNPAFSHIKMVSRERFSVSDLSVSAQIQRMTQAHPQVVIAWTTGSAVANIFKAMIQAGLSVPVVTSDGNMSTAVMHRFAAFLPKELLTATSEFLPHAGLYKLDPRVEAKQKLYEQAMAEAHMPVDLGTAGAWDATFILVDALRKLGVGATAPQVRSYIASLTDYAGIHGVYDFRARPQRGLGVKDALIARWDGKNSAWVPVSAPGGAALAAK